MAAAMFTEPGNWHLSGQNLSISDVKFAPAGFAWQAHGGDPL